MVRVDEIKKTFRVSVYYRRIMCFKVRYGEVSWLIRRV